MKFAMQRQKKEPAALAQEPELSAQPIAAYTITFETRGLQCRARYSGPDGVETVTAWRVRDHGAYAGVNELLDRWKREGVLGGYGRIPRAAGRSR